MTPTPTVFQSTPTSAGRRNDRSWLPRYGIGRFNPLRPALVGEMYRWRIRETSDTRVSIHSDQRWSEKSCGRMTVRRKLHMFQSTPTSAGRRNDVRAASTRRLRDVSIHSDQRWSEKYLQPWCIVDSLDGFNPLRPALVGEIFGLGVDLSAGGFNPLRPALVGEIGLSSGLQWLHSGCFNPLRPALVGEIGVALGHRQRP